LSVEAEAVETGCRWSQVFTDKCKASSSDWLLITHAFTPIDICALSFRTGHFKKFDIFIKMFVTALNKSKHDLFVDILTHSDMETLIMRKTNNMSTTSTTINSENINSNVSSASASGDRSATAKSLRRYVILSYRNEIDGMVHYPLNLEYETQPNAEAMRKQIVRLRKQLYDHQSNSGLAGITDRER
jgi:hypothetical protein